MDRNIVYPGAIPLDTDILTLQRSIMIGLGALARATLGTTTVFDGLACTQQAAPNMTVLVASGSVLFLSTVDATTFGSLAADTTDTLMKMGINIGPTTLATPAAGIAGQSTNYLIQGAFQESDATSVVLPYYNSSNPAVPYSGPANSGTPQNTQRLQTVNLSVKAGTPATTGTQTTPAADAGFTGLYVVTVAFGAVTVVNANISVAPGAPFLQKKVPQVPIGASSFLTTTGTFTVPTGVFLLRSVELWGGGAQGGGSSSGTQGAGGGQGGGYCQALNVAVTPGQTCSYTIGTAGSGASFNANGTAGGNTTITIGATTYAANGGAGGRSNGNEQSSGGAASNGTLNFTGGAGGAATGTTAPTLSGGYGGSSPRGGYGGSANFGTPASGSFPGGAGGGGGAGNSWPGGVGAAGAVLVQW